MKKRQNGLGVQNISDLVLKEIYGIYKTKSLTKEQIKRYKMTKRQIFEKFDNLSEDELNTRNKEVYVKNDVMTTVIKVALSGLRQYSANESPIKMMKNAFYFTLKALFLLKIFKFLS